MLQIKDLEVHYGSIPVLTGLSMQLEEGRIHVLIGPSGCGKSTLLRVLCGILPYSYGSITCRGKVFSSGTRGRFALGGTLAKDISIGYVPQNYGLLRWKTLRQNIFLSLQVGKKKASNLKAEDITAIYKKGMLIVETLGLQDILDCYPDKVSGGQQQRTALARAFVLQPDLLLMDEPFSALDAFTSETSQNLFLQLHKQYKVTTLLITHNMHEAVTLGEKILIMAQKVGITCCLENSIYGEASDPDAVIAKARLMSVMSEELRKVML